MPFSSSTTGRNVYKYTHFYFFVVVAVAVVVKHNK